MYQINKPLVHQSYPYQDHITREIMSIITIYPTLQQTYGSYSILLNSRSGLTEYDEKILIKLRGTIPIIFQSINKINKSDQTYNIPLSIYFSPNYPYTPPFLYVEPLPNMRIYESQFVNKSGLITHPLLSSWSYVSFFHHNSHITIMEEIMAHLTQRGKI
ncbi:hypothetical protein HZS_3970 [Henneguya salminicola]|nr:hypothetical protein HZS_3970 [Henneguya salminicola]